MTDKFGPRMTGTDALENAIDYIRAEMDKDGLKTHTEPVKAPIWKRGNESATMISPRHAKIPLLGLGLTVGTNGTILAEVVVVENFKEFDKLKEENVRGKIVVFAQTFVNYFETVKYRLTGASVAAKKGAVAVLVNSVGPFSMRTPHTGVLTYEDNVVKIPAACISTEDGALLLRLYRNQETIKIALNLEDENFEPGETRNLIAELPGRAGDKESVVVVSGHIDSWDVGTGSMDDGGGAYIARYATTFLHKMGLQPRRTIRTILWSAEEQGVIGSSQYMEQHKKNEQDEFNFLLESDMGTFEPTGLDFSGNEMARCMFNEVLKLLAVVNATQTTSPVQNGPDIELWTTRGFPGASLMNKNDHYFWFHHTEADSMAVEDPVNLDKGAAVFAIASYVIADLSVPFPKNVTP